MDWSSIIVGVLALVGTLCGAYFANRKQTALVTYRLEQLESQVRQHNQIISRTYKLEEQTALQDAELNRVNHRLENLEQKGA